MAWRHLADVLLGTQHAKPPDTPAARMVREQIRNRGIRDHRVLDVMSALDRRLFVPDNLAEHAFEDHPLTIGHGQTISQPYIVAAMTELLELRTHHRVLELGTGSGYQTAILSALCAEVVTVERIPELSQSAGDLLGTLGIQNVTLIVSDGSHGCPDHAPYDRIIATAAPREVHEELFEQLAPHGILLAPVGEHLSDGQSVQTLWRWVKSDDGLRKENIMQVRFVPLIED